MEKLVSELKGMLIKIRFFYESYIKILKQEQICIVKNDLFQLNKIVNKKEEVVEKIQSMDEKRLACIFNIARMTGNNTNSIKLEDIGNMLDENSRNQLFKIRAELHEVLARAKSLNHINNDLLNDSVKAINSVFTNAAGKQKVVKGYGKNGKADSGYKRQRNFLNTRI